MNYTINVYAGADKAAHQDDILAYYEARKRAYNTKWQDTYYNDYPKTHDTKDSTIFVVVKLHDEHKDQDVVIGGQRIVFSTQKEALPFEALHKIIQRERADKFPSLRKKDFLGKEDIIPAVKVEPSLAVAEVGAFAIDQQLTQNLSQKEYITMREAVYAATLAAAKERGADIALMASNRKNRLNHHAWLTREKNFEFKILGRTKQLFSNPMPPGEELEILLVNLSNKYSLSNAESILRYNQKAAQAARNGK